MTKAELIRKIAKRAGVPDSEAKVFFEIFLKKSSELLSPGEAVFLKGFGYFQLRKGKIRTNIPETENSEKDSIFVELMVYYPAKFREEEVKEEIIFNVPVLKFEDYNPLDSHFSLSIGKPVIPVVGISSSDFFIPLTGQELRKLVETRVDKLLADIVVVREYTKGSEVLIIDTDSIKSHQLEFNWGEVPSKSISDSKLTAKSKDADSETENATEKEIAWDFGEDVSKEIVEDSILDVDKEEVSIIEEQFNEEEETEEERTDWNFGVTIADEDDSDVEGNNSEEEKISESHVDSSGTNMDTVNKEGNYTLTDEEETGERFERVRSFSSYFEKDDLADLKDPSVYKYLRESDTISTEDNEPGSNMDQENMEGSNSEDEKKNKNEIDTISAIIEEPTDITDEQARNETLRFGKKDEKRKPSTKSKIITRIEERESRYSKEGSFPVFIVALIVIIAIAVALYFYLNKAFVASDKPESKQLAQSKVVHPNIVERDYSLPVSYPYNKDESTGTKADEGSINPGNFKDAKTQEVKQTGIKKSDQNKNPDTVEKPVKENKSKNVVVNKSKKGVTKSNDASSFTFEDLPPPVDMTELHKNITEAGDSYTVQVSSWKERYKAAQQVAKFKARGYDAYIEKANVSGRGTWYRVKIRNFKSMRDAEDFLLSNQ